MQNHYYVNQIIIPHIVFNITFKWQKLHNLTILTLIIYITNLKSLKNLTFLIYIISNYH